MNKISGIIFGIILILLIPVVICSWIIILLPLYIWDDIEDKYTSNVFPTLFKNDMELYIDLIKDTLWGL